MMQRKGRLLCLVLAMVLLTCTAHAESGYWSGEDAGITLTYWVALSPNAAVAIDNYAENLVYKTIMEQSGIQLEFIHPTTGEESTAFNLMLVSGKLPDIIEYNWAAYEGGAQKAIDDGVIRSLNDLLEAHAPDAYATMTATESIHRQCTTDGGVFYAFVPVVNSTSIPNGNTIDKVQSGPILRADWLGELDLNDPVTIADWTAVLTAFKEEKGAAAPLTFSGVKADYQPFAGAFDVSTSYYLDGAAVKYGPVEENYRAFLQQMNAWYAAGLLDPDFASNNAATQTSNILNGVSGAFVGASGSGVASTNQNGKALNPDFEVKGVRYPVLTEGQNPRFAGYSFETRTSGAGAITSACQNPEAAARFLNYFYTDEGGWLKNFGVEGLTYYRDEAGNVFHTDLMLNNPDGLTLKQTNGIYTRGDNPSPGPIIKVIDGNADTRAALETWFVIADDVLATAYPSSAAHTAQEAEEISVLTPNIDAYREEMFVKFIMGTANLDTDWDAYVGYLETLGISRVLELKQAAADRYNAR